MTETLLNKKHKVKADAIVKADALLKKEKTGGECVEVLGGEKGRKNRKHCKQLCEEGEKEECGGKCGSGD